MLLTKKINYKPKNNELIVLNLLSYAASKLWNVANYEKHNYKKLGFDTFPNWYDQKKRLKDNYWYKNLPSQTSQDILNVLQKSWKSFFKLKETKGIENPKPPKFKKNKSNFTFLNNGFKIIDNNTICFSISKGLKTHLKEKFSIDLKNLTLKIPNFSKVNGNIKTIEFKPLDNKTYSIYIVYEMEDIPLKNDNGKYLSIDIGVSNLFTCYDNKGKSFIISGKKALEINRYFNKKIAYYQEIDSKNQTKKGIKYPKSSKRVNLLHHKKVLQLNHFYHCTTKEVVSYCINNNISKVIIGDIKNIRENANIGKVNNQKLHSLPYSKLYGQLEYKLKLQGIELIKIKENYSSGVSPLAPKVSKEYYTKFKRKHRGLYIDDMKLFNADSVGAFNIMRLYKQNTNKEIDIILKGLSSPERIKVAM